MAKKLIVASAFSPNMLGLEEGGEATVQFKRISPQTAKFVAGAAEQFISAVGHEGTAQLLSAQLGREVPTNRIEIKLEHDSTLLIAIPATRLPEGKVLSYEELKTIPVNYFLIGLV
jgi:hypothetical protein